jgi:surface polysaccharide O-acyltransferase-like enzyme
MLVAIVPSIGTDLVMHAVGVLPPIGQPAASGPLFLATVYRTIYSILGSYIAARLAPYRPMLHALVLGVVGFIVSVIGLAVTWDKEAVFGPHWYPIALVILALPAAWIGGKLRMNQLSLGQASSRKAAA